MRDFLLSDSHDLHLPAWGPYTKKYAGISHIPDPRLGLRFDLSVFPGLYRRRVDVPAVMWESGYHPWEAAADFSWYAYRHEIEWKDRVFADIAYAAAGPKVRLIRAECVNETDAWQNLVLHFMASMNFPPLFPYSDVPIRMVRVDHPPAVAWVDAAAYARLTYANPRPQDDLTYENWFRGQTRAHGFTGGMGLGQTVGKPFGEDAGDTVTYKIDTATTAEAGLLIRYRPRDQGRVSYVLTGDVRRRVTLEANPSADTFGFCTVIVPLGAVSAGRMTVTLTSEGGVSEVQLDGLAMGPRAQLAAVTFTEVIWRHAPEAMPGPVENSLILQYPDAPCAYGLRWDFEPFEIRRIHAGELDRFFRAKVHDHTAVDLRGAGDGHFTNIFLRPIALAPRTRRTIRGLVCAGTVEEVRTQLGAFPTPEAAEATCAAARAKAITYPDSPDAFGQRLMAATMLTNVVYPVITRGTYIRHGTPGRVWDCLYTWDSGFIGLGLVELDTDRAIDNLNAYVNDPGDPHAAFPHHGTPLPVQAWLYQAIFNRTQSRDFLDHYYPRMLQFHRFLAGRAGSSTTRRLKSGMLNTWHYFYNSGGWDDYPPQKAVHEENLANHMAPCINTAHGIRTAKILRGAAEILGHTTEFAELDRDTAELTAALQQHAWDPEAGYFGYVRHDDGGRPTGLFRHASGQNYNMGLDGVSPMVADACTPEQERRLLAHLFDPRRLWSPIGLSTVDQSAAYYRHDGYWNGAVWMPHQWFVWRALLDLNRGDEAFRVARTALDLWSREVGESYNCFEHFLIQSRRGAGWHQFGGLSAPVLSWYGAYYQPGRVTTGANTWVLSRACSATSLTATLWNTGSRAAAVVVTPPGDGMSSVRLDDQPIRPNRRYGGAWEVVLPPGRHTVTVAC